MSIKTNIAIAAALLALVGSSQLASAQDASYAQQVGDAATAAQWNTPRNTRQLPGYFPQDARGSVETVARHHAAPTYDRQTTGESSNGWYEMHRDPANDR